MRGLGSFLAYVLALAVSIAFAFALGKWPRQEEWMFAVIIAVPYSVPTYALVAALTRFVFRGGRSTAAAVYAALGFGLMAFMFWGASVRGGPFYGFWTTLGNSNLAYALFVIAPIFVAAAVREMVLIGTDSKRPDPSATITR